ncbi:hypothetical protein Tco_1342826 [Tanacetum coccineum]
MSSPNYPTSDIEDTFSSNFPDYIPASPDYVPASPGKTYSSSSNNSFGTNKTNITRKPSKTGKHEHGNQKSTKEAKDSKPKPRKVNYGQASVKESQP